MLTGFSLARLDHKLDQTGQGALLSVAVVLCTSPHSLRVIVDWKIVAPDDNGQIRFGETDARLAEQGRLPRGPTFGRVDRLGPARLLPP